MKSKKRGKSKLNNNQVWTIFGVVLVLSLIVIFFLSPYIHLSGSAVQTVSHIKAGDELFFEVKVDGVKDITVTFSKDVKDIMIVTEPVDKVGWDFKGIIYSMFKISSQDADKISKLVLTLKIKEQELYNSGLAKYDVRAYLNRQELETTFETQEGDYFYYKVKSSGFGDYVIGKAEVAKIPVKEVPPVIEPSKAAPVPEVPKAVEPAPEQPAPLAGKASEQETQSRGIFPEVADFFRKLFS
ncbi:hypothetical protein HZC32_00440 [Candidatus Woesearchaeota archaeon]|nr:hypothetical protein [Candidatus Woesearchaeota archaeon]